MSEHLQIAAVPEGKPRVEKAWGRDHSVFPAVLVRQQVLNNNLGRTFLPAEEIEASVDAWNGIPVVIRHPRKGGSPISAREPDVLNERGVGHLFRARYEDGALKADVFVDLERGRQVADASSVINAVESGNVGELSTGFGTNVEAESGEFEGSPYDVTLRGVAPDHLALLVDETGACSVRDGCGLGVNHAGPCQTDEQSVGERVVAFLQERFGLFPDADKRPEDTGDNDGEDMKREDMIAQLAEAGPLEAEALDALNDCQLKALLEAGTEPEPTPATNDEPDAKDETIAALEERLAKLEDAADTVMADNQRERDELIKKLAANERCAFEEAELHPMPTAHLRKLAKSCQVPLYVGRGGPQAATNSDEAFAPVRPYWKKED